MEGIARAAFTEERHDTADGTQSIAGDADIERIIPLAAKDQYLSRGPRPRDLQLIGQCSQLDEQAGAAVGGRGVINGAGIPQTRHPAGGHDAGGQRGRAPSGTEVDGVTRPAVAAVPRIDGQRCGDARQRPR